MCIVSTSHTLRLSPISDYHHLQYPNESSYHPPQKDVGIIAIATVSILYTQYRKGITHLKICLMDL